MTKKCEDCEKHKNGDCKCNECPECAVLFDNDGNYYGSVCDSHSETCKTCKENYALMRLEEIEEWYKKVVITVDELRKLYTHEPFGKTKVFVTSQKAWDNLGKLSTTPTEDRQKVAERKWSALLNDLYEMARDTEDHKEIMVLDRRVRDFIRTKRVE